MARDITAQSTQPLANLASELWYHFQYAQQIRPLANFPSLLITSLSFKLCQPSLFPYYINTPTHHTVFIFAARLAIAFFRFVRVFLRANQANQQWANRSGWQPSMRF